MDDVSLTRLLAEKVMGWGIEYPLRAMPERDGVFLRLRPDSTVVREWRPLESMDDAWMIIKRLQADGWDYELGSCMLIDGIITEGHSAEFMRGAYDLYDDTREVSYIATAPTPQRAICKAALKITQEGDQSDA